MSNIPLHVVFVEAWIKKGDRYLLARRSSQDEQAAGKWAVPGGKIEMELECDIVENTLKREVQEETGIKVRDIRFFASRSFIRASGHHVVALSFVAKYESGEASPLEDQDEVRWVTLREMEQLLDNHWAKVLNALKEFDN